ncbi:hypothetical protein OUZ56_021914 [Daphnia magna]|uniref:Uncharacterized protein n=1 Tax=Daphnia magna TaxID=35525 RepID=A0ABR0AUV0_9CRUS|nr:hypothetical protein OUZ56_021914 [Daphnia magna]
MTHHDPARVREPLTLSRFEPPANRLTIAPPLTCEAKGKHGAIWCGSETVIGQQNGRAMRQQRRYLWWTKVHMTKALQQRGAKENGRKLQEEETA